MPDPLITAAQLRLFAPQCAYLTIAPFLDRAAAGEEINTPRRIRQWMAHVYVETFGLTRLIESLNYSAQRLCAVWPHRFPTLAAAEPYAKNGAALAEKVYGGRMGNDHLGDGAAYIGRGGIMRTGKAGYAAAQASFAAAGVTVDLLSNPALLATNDHAWQDAANFWAQHDLNQVADADDGERIYSTVQAEILGDEMDDLESSTITINGALTGWPERKQQLLRAGVIWHD